MIGEVDTELAVGSHPAARQDVASDVNVGGIERLLTGVLAGALIGRAILRPSASSLILAGIGGALLYRAGSGYCPLYDMIEMTESCEGADEDVDRPG